jgi:hypothetical protein
MELKLSRDGLFSHERPPQSRRQGLKNALVPIDDDVEPESFGRE